MNILEKIDNFLKIDESIDMKKVEKYIKSIKNKEKKLYAEYYLDYLMGKKKKPDSSSFKLSYMAAQEVRMTLFDLGFKKEPGE